MGPLQWCVVFERQAGVGGGRGECQEAPRYPGQLPSPDPGCQEEPTGRHHSEQEQLRPHAPSRVDAVRRGIVREPWGMRTVKGRMWGDNAGEMIRKVDAKSRNHPVQEPWEAFGKEGMDGSVRSYKGLK